MDDAKFCCQFIIFYNNNKICDITLVLFWVFLLAVEKKILKKHLSARVR